MTKILVLVVDFVKPKLQTVQFMWKKPSKETLESTQTNVLKVAVIVWMFVRFRVFWFCLIQAKLKLTKTIVFTVAFVRWSVHSKEL